MKDEKCILTSTWYYDIPIYNERKDGTAKHHIFFGTGNRALSERYGLVCFLYPEHHNMSNAGVHFDHDFDLWLKQYAQKAAMEYYHWSIEDFIKIFGRNFIE